MIIVFNNTALLHTGKRFCNMFEVFNWEMLYYAILSRLESFRLQLVCASRLRSYRAHALIRMNVQKHKLVSC